MWRGAVPSAELDREKGKGAVLFVARVICVLGVSFQEKFTTALVDNYAYTGQTFQLRYFLSDDCVPASGSYPLFFYTGNEGDVELYVNNTGFMVELAGNHSALLVFAEHRYYGKSLPIPSASSSADLKYFSPHQALADYAYLISSLLEEYSVSTVVAFGGSYGGMLASWIRIKYPHLVDGALASSAPDLHFSLITDPNLFAQMATLSFAIESSICVENIRAGFQTLLTYTQSPQYFYQLSQIFQTCTVIPTTDTAELLLDWAVDGLTGLAMLNYPYAANYGTELPQWPVGFACDLISDSMAQTPVQKLTDLFLAANVYYNYSGAQPCTNLTSELAYDLPWLWSYVRCSTLIMPIGYTGVDDMFYSQPWNPSAFRSFCENRFGSIKSQPSYAYIMYGSTNVTGNTFIYLSNVIFSNGEIDPWQSGGVYEPINPAVTTIYIQLAAHHLDLRGTNKADFAAISAAREQEASIIQQWIETNRSDKEAGRLIEAEFEQRSVLCPCKLGVVEKAKEKATGRTVAIKQVTSFSKQTIRELRLHRALQHENILTPERVLLEEGQSGLTLAKVTPLMDSDLSRLIAEGTLRDEHCIFLLYQLLRGLKFLHSSSVAHRSLSPRHILVNSNCDLRLSHLETACLLEWAKVPTRLPETQSDRWYLSPERLLGEAGGGTEDDMWAVGCIFGEMLFQKPLFASETAGEQLSLILALIPGPDAHSLSRFGSVFTVESLKQMSKAEHCSSLLGKLDPLARSLLMGLLKFSAEERLTVTEALEHEYLSDFHDYEDEPTGELLSLSSFSFETVRLTSSDIATLLADEVRLFSAI